MKSIQEQCHGEGWEMILEQESLNLNMVSQNERCHLWGVGKLIYTIGHKESYDKGFIEFKDNPEDFKKMGKREDYIGGSVFKGYWDANNYLRNKDIRDFYVYCVLEDWENTEPNEHGEFNNLINDAQLIKSVNISNERIVSWGSE